MGEIGFDKEGRIILPESVKSSLEEEKRREEETKKFDKKLILNYLGSESEGFMKCEFKIELPYGVYGIRKKIFEVKTWADKNVKLKERARCWLERDGEGYILKISGHGDDERCTWCRSFRTALNTSTFDLKVAVLQRKFCKFDRESYNKIRRF